MQEFVKYYDTLKSQDLSEITEHTLRPVLNELLTSIAKELNPNIKIIHEPKREGKFGAPDFKVFEADNIIGYVENKKIDESLDKVLKSEQIKKYKELSNNLLLTNYLEWFWIHNGEVQRRESLCSIADIENQHFQLNSDKAKVVKELITHYLSTPPQGIAEAKKLAESLAIRARLLKDFIFEELERQKLLEDQPKLKGLYHTFKDFIFSDLTTSEFSDAFAQTLIYGLFLAKLNADLQQVNLYNVSQFIPTSFQLIKELVDFLKELENPNYKEIRWIVEEVLTIMNTLDLRAIQANLSFSKSEDPSESLELFESSHKDPYIYFYEDFLAAYDKDLRKAKGVYYTPSAVVSFIVKSINEILRNDFNIKTGLADEKQVTVLDFATGTGTFLVEIFQVIFETISNSGKKNLLIKEHLLKNIYGFEYLIAPYTIAHLKLSQFLREQGYELTDGERIQVFLTNTLEPIDKQIKIPLLPALTKESRNAQEIKDKPILVITGNPPYSVSSSNKSSFIDNLMRKYKEGLQEKNIQSLSDDYIKFICFAHDKIEKAGRGVIAIITNNSYLSGSIHRKMRETLYKDFDKIYVLNLHGNSLRKEQGENVFDIRIGVSILFLVKLEKYQKEKQVFYFSTQAREILTRKDKFSFLSNNDLSTVRWLELKPQSPDFWFIEKDLSNQAEYNQFWSVTEIFKNYTSGVKTHRDKLLIDRSKVNLESRLYDFFTGDYSNGERISKYGLNKVDSKKLDKFLQSNFDRSKIRNYAYRIFDKYYIYYDTNLIERSRNNLMQHYLKNGTLNLNTTRLLSSEKFTHVFISNEITDICYVSNNTRETNYIFPLYIFQEKNIFEKRAKRTEKQLRKAIEEADRNFEKAWAEFQRAKTIEGKDKAGLEEYLAKVEEAKALKELLRNEELRMQSQESDYVKIPNFTREFEDYIHAHYNTELTPEQILGYIYAILHCPNYREKYNEFLKTDYPKIPFLADLTTFQQLSNMGNELIKAHLLDNTYIESIKDKYPKVDFIGEGNFEITKVDFIKNKVWINSNQYFDNVPENIWNFKIGAYYPMQKYLRERKGATISLEDLHVIENQIIAIAFTIEKMNELENLTKHLI